MAGRFEGVSDLEWRLFEDVFPGTAQAQSWDAACAISADIEYVVVCLDYGVPMV